MLYRNFMSRRSLVRAGAGCAALTLSGSPLRTSLVSATPTTGDPEVAAAIQSIAEEQRESVSLQAVLWHVRRGGEEIASGAIGESMNGVPATVDMRFRNGAVAIAYSATLLLRFVDRGMAALDDPIARWLPDLPDADQATLRMLANMTAGYRDFVQNETFIDRFYADPFQQWQPEEQIEIGLSAPRLFAPGENWEYSHTNYVILGRALEAIGGAPLDVLLQREVLDPLGLDETVASSTPAIPAPVLHAFTAERKQLLGIAPETRFFEESTFWNPSWTLAAGSIQTSTVRDVARSAEAIGEGTLLSPESHAEQISRGLAGFGRPVDGCNSCHTLDEAFTYGLGVALAGDWIGQNPAFGGYAAAMAYLPSGRLAIAVAATYREEAFDSDGAQKIHNGAVPVFEQIATLLAPGNLPPSR
jgi:CubicO group peptidase (beta-lactamase class C family)